MFKVYIFFAVLVIITTGLFYGCGGGNAVISNIGEEVVTGELVLDSIPRAPEEDEYLIGQGDKLDIVFLYNREFSQKDIVVRSDGKISLPYAGELRVAGITVSRLDSILTAKYSEILINPDISVIVKEYKPQLIYVLGEVELPGGYPYKRGMTLLSALSLGRGLTDDARKNGVLVLRRVAPDHVVGIQIDLNELMGKKIFSLDIPLEPFDIVMVPKSKLSSVRDFSETLYSILAKPADLYIKGWNIANMKILFDFYKRTARTF